MYYILAINKNKEKTVINLFRDRKKSIDTAFNMWNAHDYSGQWVHYYVMKNDLVVIDLVAPCD